MITKDKKLITAAMAKQVTLSTRTAIHDLAIIFFNIRTLSARRANLSS